MAEATRRLSQSCKLQATKNSIDSSSGIAHDGDSANLSEKERHFYSERKKSVGDEMVGVLQVLGKILDEVADAQMLMCQTLEASLSLSLETFIGTELQQATNLKTEAEEMTESAESAFAKYLHGKHAQNAATSSDTDMHTGPVSSSWNKISEGVGSQLGRIGISTGTSANNDSPRRKGKAGHGPDKSKGEPVDKALFAANLKQNLEEIRVEQANSELKRFQLLKHLDALKTRRNFELGESVLASLNGIKGYFHQCSDLTQGLQPRLHSIQKQQAEARGKYESQQAPLESREKGLLQAINEIKISAANAGVIADAISRGQTTGLGASMIADQPTSLEDIEEETQIWELPRLLTDHALYMRDPKAGIEVEGWMYKKASSRMAMSVWSKRWFVLDKSGIYYLKGGSLSENKKIGNCSLERVKVCDIVLCTVREVNDPVKQVNGVRFCFEILSPNSRPYMLQACGPVDFKMWVNSIRHCLERQLVHGNVPSDDQLLKLGAPKVKRMQEEDATFSPKISSDEMSVSDSVSTFNSVQSPAPKNPMVQKILEKNRVCADCCKRLPEWVSINLGAMICIECSGVHRSLGVHVSKVRSLRLDQLSKAEYALILSLGNDFVNSVWEGGVNKQKGWTKPEASDSRKIKEEWIKSKYMWRGFIDFKEEDGQNQDEREANFNAGLYEAAKRGDVRATAEALAKGAK